MLPMSGNFRSSDLTGKHSPWRAIKNQCSAASAECVMSAALVTMALLRAEIEDTVWIEP